MTRNHHSNGASKKPDEWKLNNPIISEIEATVRIANDGDTDYEDIKGWSLHTVVETDGEEFAGLRTEPVPNTSPGFGLWAMLDRDRILSELPEWVVQAGERGALSPGLVLGKLVLSDREMSQFNVASCLID